MSQVMRSIFWFGAVIMIYFANDEVISDNAQYICMIMTLLAGCWVWGGDHNA